ncbi:MAG: hypothetical protein OMM_12029 [Candidatus Magnetoglobus multicellularis str. Araruama]|uniref:Uncharacterized protein n=1 Tax=Candidatus Magnetoglobus multicellularis str. Araruama TaxID=890399 RepID=A0A1V1NWQ8_9BACT|nr:MAG: hypothetical protein OMM_12029 [Candidatus Magnetoglobus multicellularis str. Araruama]
MKHSLFFNKCIGKTLLIFVQTIISNKNFPLMFATFDVCQDEMYIIVKYQSREKDSPVSIDINMLFLYCLHANDK